MYSVYSVVHINHELHIRGSSDAQRADTKLWSFILHQLFKQHNRIQSATQVGGSSHPHPMRKEFICPSIQAIPHIRFPTANQSHCKSQQRHHRHFTNPAIQSKVTLPQSRHQPEGNEQPTYDANPKISHLQLDISNPICAGDWGSHAFALMN